MSITTEQYKKIIRFLDAEMDPAEMDDFEKELTTNPELRMQLDFEQSLRDGFALHNISSLHGSVPANESIKAPAIPGKVKAMRKWLAISAAVVLIAAILLTIFWRNPGKTPDVAKGNSSDTAQNKNILLPAPENSVAKDTSKNIDLAQLFKQYFKKDALPGQYPLYLAEALMDYEAGNYTTLQQLNLKDLPEVRGAGETDSKENILQLGHYYKGLAFLQTGNNKDAIVNLDWVINNQPGKALRTKAQWYLALAYLKENNREKVADLCNNIVDNKNNDSLIKKAEKILDTLRK